MPSNHLSSPAQNRLTRCPTASLPYCLAQASLALVSASMLLRPLVRRGAFESESKKGGTAAFTDAGSSASMRTVACACSVRRLLMTAPAVHAGATSARGWTALSVAGISDEAAVPPARALPSASIESRS